MINLANEYKNPFPINDIDPEYAHQMDNEACLSLILCDIVDGEPDFDTEDELRRQVESFEVWRDDHNIQVEIDWRLPELSNLNLIKDALFNADSRIATTNEQANHAQGIVVGIVSALMSIGWTYNQIIKLICRNLPSKVNIDCLPAAFRDEIEKHRPDVFF